MVILRFFQNCLLIHSLRILNQFLLLYSKMLFKRINKKGTLFTKHFTLLWGEGYRAITVAKIACHKPPLPLEKKKICSGNNLRASLAEIPNLTMSKTNKQTNRKPPLPRPLPSPTKKIEKPHFDSSRQAALWGFVWKRRKYLVNCREPIR